MATKHRKATPYTVMVGPGVVARNGSERKPLTSAVATRQANGTSPPPPSEAVKKVLAKRQDKIDATVKKGGELYRSAKSAVARITDKSMRESVLID